MKSNKVIGIIAIIFGALILIGPWTFVHVCHGMEGMESVCHTTRLWATVIGIIILLIGMCIFMMKNRIGSSIMMALLVIAGVVVILLPTVLAPVCEMNTMHCRTHTMPFLILMGCLLTVIALGALVIRFLLKGKQSRAEIEEEAGVLPKEEGTPKPETPEEPANPDQDKGD